MDARAQQRPLTEHICKEAGRKGYCATGSRSDHLFSLSVVYAQKDQTQYSAHACQKSTPAQHTPRSLVLTSSTISGETCSLSLICRPSCRRRAISSISSSLSERMSCPDCACCWGPSPAPLSVLTLTVAPSKTVVCVRCCSESLRWTSASRAMKGRWLDVS